MEIVVDLEEFEGVRHTVHAWDLDHYMSWRYRSHWLDSFTAVAFQFPLFFDSLWNAIDGIP